MKRRDFLVGAVTASTIAAVETRSKAARSVNDQVNVAMMGVRGRGPRLIECFASMSDVNISYVCDVDQNVVEPAMKMIEQAKGKRPPLVDDIRRVLDDKSVDAVIIATPVHWNAPGTILACEAGKDVYV